MENEKFRKKIRRMSGIASAALIIYMVLPLITFAVNFSRGFNEGYNEEAKAGIADMISGLLIIAVFVIGITAIVSVLRLLLSMRRDESPFTEENGIRIRRTGIMLMLIEPMCFLSDFIMNGSEAETYGLTFASGLILYCVSLVFRYGAYLQQESDETL